MTPTTRLAEPPAWRSWHAGAGPHWPAPHSTLFFCGEKCEKTLCQAHLRVLHHQLESEKKVNSDLGENQEDFHEKQGPRSAPQSAQKCVFESDAVERCLGRKPWRPELGPPPPGTGMSTSCSESDPEGEHLPDRSCAVRLALHPSALANFCPRENYLGTRPQSTRIAKWRKLYERFSRFSGCWITHFEVEIPTLPVDQCHSHLIHNLKGSWGILSQRRAAEKGRPAFGKHIVNRETFCKSTCIFIGSLSSRIKSMEFVNRRVASFVRSEEKWKARNASWTVSQRFSHPQWRRLFKELWGKPTTFACWRIRFKTEVCTCSQFSTEAMQWIKRVEMVDWCEDCFPSSKRDSVWRNRRPRSRTVSFVAGRLLSWSTITSGSLWSPGFCRELCRPIHYQSSKWWFSGIRFKVGRNLIVYDEIPTWWHLGKIVQIKNLRVRENQDRIGNCMTWKLIRKIRTWLSQIENYGEKKYRARYSQSEFWSQKRKLWEERLAQQSGNKNSVYKEFLEIVGNGKPTGSVWKETIAMSVEKFHHQIRLRILSCSRMTENHREPEVPEAGAPVWNVSMALQGSPQRNLQ